MYGWRSSGVNHVLIFELDPRNHLSEQHLIEMAAIFGVVWALSLLSFLYSASLSIPPYVNPLALTVIMILFVINPLKVFRHDARFWFVKICVSILFYFSSIFVEVIFWCLRFYTLILNTILPIVVLPKILNYFLSDKRILQVSYLFCSLYFAHVFFYSLLHSPQQRCLSIPRAKP